MHSVAELERDSTLQLETTGLTLAEGKQILKHVQEVVVEEQVQACLIRHRHCAICSKPHSTKGHHQIKLQTVFGNLQIKSPRLRCCPSGEADRTKSFSPLAQVFSEHAGETLSGDAFRVSASYGATTGLLTELLPLDEELNAVTIRNHLLKVAECSEFRRDEAGQNKSSKCFGFVQNYDASLCSNSQGMQENQLVVFLSDGGEDVRNLQFYLNPLVPRHHAADSPDSDCQRPAGDDRRRRRPTTAAL